MQPRTPTQKYIFRPNLLIFSTMPLRPHFGLSSSDSTGPALDFTALLIVSILDQDSHSFSQDFCHSWFSLGLPACSSAARPDLTAGLTTHHAPHCVHTLTYLTPNAHFYERTQPKLQTLRHNAHGTQCTPPHQHSQPLLTALSQCAR